MYRRGRGSRSHGSRCVCPCVSLCVCVRAAPRYRVQGGGRSLNTQVKLKDPSEMEKLTPEERRVLERKVKKQRKKEEKQLKRESLPGETKTEPAKSPTAGELALQYLDSWSKKSPEWKFQKSRQTWLLMNMYDPKKVSDEYFKKLLPYLEGLMGSARDTTVKKAEEYMKESDSRETKEESDEHRINRIREVLQLLC